MKKERNPYGIRAGLKAIWRYMTFREVDVVLTALAVIIWMLSALLLLIGFVLFSILS